MRTGQKLKYRTNGGIGVSVSNTGVGGTFTLADGSIVYAINVSKDAVGLSTSKVAIGTDTPMVGVGSTAYQLRFLSVGTGVTLKASIGI